MIEQMTHPQGKTSELVERLRQQAARTSDAHKMLADAKSARNKAADPDSGGYSWVTPEQTLEWQAASELTRLEAEVGRLRDRLAHWDRAAEKLEYGLRDRGGWPTGQSKLVAAAFENVRQQTASLLSRLQSGSENKGLAGVPGDLASASGVFSPESEAGDSPPHHTKGRG